MSDLLRPFAVARPAVAGPRRPGGGRRRALAVAPPTARRRRLGGPRACGSASPPAALPGRRAVSVALLALAVLGAALALARPRWGSEVQTVERRGVDLVFVLDSSLSMAARDVTPSRLWVAKALIRRLAEEMPGNRVALVESEGEGQVLTPLTVDAAVLDLLLDAVEPGSLPVPGTELAPGLTTALGLFAEGAVPGGGHRIIVLVSDGEDHGGGLERAAARLREEGVVVAALGVGTPAGGPLPLPVTPAPPPSATGAAPVEVKRDEDGRPVISRLDEAALEGLARETGGVYVRATSAAADVAPHRAADPGDGPAGVRDRHPQHAGGALPVAAGDGRRGPPAPPRGRPVPPRAATPGRRRGRAMTRTGTFAAAALVALQLPFGLHPPVWVERLLWNPRERTAAGSDAYQAGRFDDAVADLDRARRVAGEPPPPAVDFNAATAHLAAGEAGAAVPLLEAAVERTADAAAKAGGDRGGLATAARYNLGNARLAAGDLPGAVEAYKSALRLAPDHADAKYNLELALRRLAERRRPRLKPPEESPAGTGAGERERSPQGGGSRPLRGARRRPRPPRRRRPAVAGAHRGGAGRALPDATAPPAAAAARLPGPARHDRRPGGGAARGGREPRARAAPRQAAAQRARRKRRGEQGLVMAAPGGSHGRRRAGAALGAAVIALLAGLAATPPAAAAEVEVSASLEPQRLTAGDLAVLTLEARGGIFSHVRFRPDFELDNLAVVAGPDAVGEPVGRQRRHRAQLPPHLAAARPGRGTGRGARDRRRFRSRAGGDRPARRDGRRRAGGRPELGRRPPLRTPARPRRQGLPQRRGGAAAARGPGSRCSTRCGSTPRCGSPR